MTRPGVYMVKSTGAIWAVEKLEYYEDLNREFVIVTEGLVDGREIHRCLITSDQFKYFVRIGEL